MRIERMTTPHSGVSSDAMTTAAATIRYLQGPIEQLEVEQLESDEAWLGTFVEQASPREQMQRSHP